MSFGDTTERGRSAIPNVLLVGGLLAALVGGWVGYRVMSKPKADPKDDPPAVVASSTTENPKASVQPKPTTAAAPQATTPKESPAPPSPQPQSAPALEAAPSAPPAGPEPDLDDLVRKEAAKAKEWADTAKGGKLEAVKTPEAVRTPEQVAAEIDRIIDARLANAKITPSPKADDAEFLRRAYLDIAGVVPPVAKVKAFLADKSPDKRAKLVDELLASHDYGEHFAHYWHELLVKRDPENNLTIQTHDVFVKWMTRQLNNNRPWDEVVRTMLTAAGDQALAGETFFILANSEAGQPAPSKIVGTAAALFLGNQLMCAECHVHPMIPEWKQQDFWGLATFFGRTRAVRGEQAKLPNNVLARIVEAPPGGKGGKNSDLLPDGSIAIPDPRNEGKVIGAAKPKLFGPENPVVSADRVRRATVADWFVSGANPYFPRAAANRVWSMYFGRGLINPLDDIRPDSKASHPELLELLSGELVASKFDLKHLVRGICRSEAYQRSSKTFPDNKDDEELYSHMALKVVPPRALLVSLSKITDGQIKLPKDEIVGKRGEISGGFAFYDTREYDEMPTEYTYGVPQFLRLMNTKLPAACDSVGKAVVKVGPREDVVKHLYLLALSRPPTQAELSRMTAFSARQSDASKGYSAVLWVLLTSAEFFNNH
jgi:hypothetical protein